MVKELNFIGSINYSNSSNINSDKIIKNISGLEEFSFDFALIKKSLFYKNDFLSFRIKQDPRIEKARVSLNIPKGRNPNGVIEFQSLTLPITPSGREINFETSWSFHRDNSKSFINLSFIDDKDHIKTKDIEINLIFAHQRFF